MRLLVFSDIHGNLEALQCMLRDAADRNVHRSICLGDLVGYGPYPNECIELLRGLKNCRCLAGNHDVAVLWETSPYGMSSAANEAILWTMEQLTAENKAYLAALPDRLDVADMTFVHANPYNPRGWRYVLDRKYALRSFAATRCRCLFIGHSHRPLLITRKSLLTIDLQAVSASMRYRVDDTRRRIINCGSVGQPRDNDPRSCYLIFDSRKQEIEFHRVAYDIEKSVKAFHSAGLPPELGARLFKGV
ncbi:MAG: metallophosphoesterase [Proteobacteria bacterium]|nr:metallophosphoesterase [Pseudomonadota bacterium]MBU1419198.1 metallophosphoesterase [Pseudomonadota bacterium]MBU1454263.1 metallophosphoesterase [Pseudomonadota bacterium]